MISSKFDTQVFTASGTYTPTPGMTSCLVICIGGGAGGADATATDEAGGGGGAGGAAIKLFQAADIGASKTVTVGAQVASDTSGNTSGLGTANALLQATGGTCNTTGTGAFTVVLSCAGGVGGIGTLGDLNIQGEPGGRGVIYSGADGVGGNGGRSIWGGGGASGGTDGVGGAGGLYGGGGAGGHAVGSPNRAGGTGAAGIVYILEFFDSVDPMREILGIFGLVRRGKAYIDALIPNLLSSTLSAAPPPADIPLPRTGGTFQRLRRAAAIVADAIPNLLVTTLAVAVGNPFINTEAQAQPRPRRAPQAEVRPNLLTTTLAAAPPADVVSPRSRISKPPPRRLIPRAEEYRNLLILTTPIPTPPVQREEQPASLRIRRAPQDFIRPNLLTTTLSVVTQDPFKPGDPRQLTRRSQREQPFDVERNLVRLTTAVPNPPVQQEAQLVQPRPRRAPKDEARPNLSTSTLFIAVPAGDPFKPEQSSAPRRRRPPPSPEAIRNALTVPGYEVLGVGSTQIDSGVIPNRRRDARLAYRDDETRNLLHSTLFVPAAPDPAVGSICVDASSPRFRYRANLDPQVQSRIALLTATPPLPKVQAEPSPPPRPKRARLDPEIPNLTLSLPPEVQEFVIRLASFGQAPKTRRAGRPQEPSRSLALTTAPVQNPPVKVETPLPVRPKPTWRDPQVPSRITLLTAPIPLPQVQVEIALPVRPKPTWRDPQHQSRIALLTATAPLPKIQVETALPVRSRKAPQEQLSPNLLGTTLAAPVVEVVNVRGKVSAAARRIRRLATQEISNRTILLPAAVINPQVQVETPQVPARTRYKSSDETYRPPPIPVPDPFVQVETPLEPTRRPAIQIDHVRNLALLTAPVPNPPVKVETPLPVRPKQTWRDPQHQSRIALLTAIAPLPKIQQETPLFPPVRPAKLDLEIQSMLALLSASLPFPNVQVELALPVNPKRTWLDPEHQNQSLLPYNVFPPVQVEIPLPVRPKKAWRDPEQQNRIPLLLSAIPEFQVEDPLFPTPKRAWIDPEHQSRISLLTAIAPLPKVVVDTSVPPRRIHAVWIPDQFNVPILELITNAYRPDIELTLNINRTVSWNLEINRTVEESTEINRNVDTSLDLTGE